MMETWDVTHVDFLAEADLDRPDAAVPIRCAQVQWRPASDVSGERAQQEALPLLVLLGADVGAVRALATPPALVRFDARGYLETREFPVEGLRIPPDGNSVELYLAPATQP
ncbi:hypothetical protein BRI6_3036 [plant metagenome]|uniref:Uncharacterized protein n=1 Tax=plant metagenome TaxID=1297885 RepID=A0A484SKX8_9ZZZZ